MLCVLLFSMNMIYYWIKCVDILYSDRNNSRLCARPTSRQGNNAYLLFINCHHRNHIIFIHEYRGLPLCSFRIHIQFYICTIFFLQSHSNSMVLWRWKQTHTRINHSRHIHKIEKKTCWTMEGVGGLTNISYFHAARLFSFCCLFFLLFVSFSLAVAHWRPHIKFIINSIHFFVSTCTHFVYYINTNKIHHSHLFDPI